MVRCAQYGTSIQVRVCDLSNEEGNPLSERELVAGAPLLLDVKGKSFPVTFIGSEGDLLVLFKYSVLPSNWSETPYTGYCTFTC